MKTHFSTILEYDSCTITTTLCGRNAPSNGELNCSGDLDQVNCEICKSAIGNSKNWRWNKFLKFGVEPKITAEILYYQKDRVTNPPSEAG